MRKAFPHRKPVKFNWGLATLLLLVVAAAPLLLVRKAHKHAQAVEAHRQTAQESSAIKQQLALQRHVHALLRKCPLPGYCIRDEGLPGPSEYLSSSGPGHPGMQRQRGILTRHLNSSGFQDRLRQLRSLPDKQGILISAGKPHHIGNAAVLLHVLRRHHNCSLPVEIAHRGDSEVDNTTRASIAAAFPPLYWLDLDKQQYPSHHDKDYTMDRYEPKIYALYHTRFQQVLMLDADNLPLKDPTYLFSAPQLTQHGMLTWLDLWSPGLSSTTFVGWDTVYPLVGLNKEPYLKALTGGQGYVRRVAESGQLLLDRVVHADVLEWLWMFTSFSKDLYKHILGDKDTFGFAFAAARQLHRLHAVPLPPGVALRYELSGKPWQQQGKWHFNGMMQYDHLGDQVFFHRTLEKWNDVRSMPPIMDAVTGPVPNWFVLSFLGDSTSGFQPDIPEHVLQPLAPPACPIQTPLPTHVLNNSYTPADTPQTSAPKAARAGRPISSSATAAGSTTAGRLPAGKCPLSFLEEFYELRDLGLPLTWPVGLESSCKQRLQLLREQGKQLAAAAGSSRSGTAQKRMAAAGSAAGSAGPQDQAVAAVIAESAPWLGDVWIAFEQDALPTTVSVTGGSRGGRQLKSTQQRRHRRMQQQQQQQQQQHDINQAQLQERELQRYELFPRLNEHVWRAGCNSLQHAGSVAVAESNSVQKCEGVSWHTARFMLPEYAEKVGRDGNAAPVKFQASKATAALPVLWLNSVPKAFAGGGCCSLMDALQQKALPAAVQWVNDNIDKLPYLKQ